MGGRVSEEIVDGLIERDGGTGFLETGEDSVDAHELMWIPQRPCHSILDIDHNHEKRVRGIAFGWERVLEIGIGNARVAELAELKNQGAERVAVARDVRESGLGTSRVRFKVGGEKPVPEVDGVIVSFVAAMLPDVDRSFLPPFIAQFAG